MSGHYAQRTSVDSGATRAEIERTLTKYGAKSFMYGWDENRAALAFTINDRQVRFVLPMPDRNDRRFTHTPAKGQARSADAAAKEYDQAVRQSWRALALVVKAKLEAVASGIVTFDQEFFAHLVLPNNQTVFEAAGPAVVTAYETGTIGPLLQLGSSPGRD
jgi:hypothetical protein